MLGTLLFFVCANAKGQSAEAITISRFGLYGDLGGGISRGMASINFEGRISSGKKISWYARGGIGAGGIEEEGGPGILGGISMLTGRGKNHFEVNGGTFVGKHTDVRDEIFFLPILDLGYRYQKLGGGFIFRARVGFLGIGIGLGYAF